MLSRPLLLSLSILAVGARLATATDFRQLTTAGADIEPAWSPTGAQIVFTSDQAGNFDIWVISSSGGTPTQITTDQAFDGGPGWSPDGSQIVFHSSRGESPDWGIWIMPSTGGQATTLAVNAAIDLEPVWSPNDDRIAFRSDRSGNDDIWVVPASDGIPVQMTTHPDDRQPAWSPDGSQIAFQSNRGGDWDIWIMPSSGGGGNATDDPPRERL
jgi:TolB protein